MTEDYFIYCLKNRLTVFNFTLYLNIIEKKIFNYINEWNLLNDNNKIPHKISYYYDFLYLLLEKEVLNLRILEKELHSKSIIVFNKQDSTNYSNNFENYDKFINQIIKILKKLHKNVFLTTLSFNNTIGKYKNLKCLELNGEENEFFQKNNLTL